MELTRHRHRKRERLEGDGEVATSSMFLCCKAFGGGTRSSEVAAAAVAWLCILSLSALLVLLLHHPRWLVGAGEGTASSSSLSRDPEYAPWRSRAPSLTSSSKPTFANQVLPAPRSEEGGGGARLPHSPRQRRLAYKTGRRTTRRTLMFAAVPGSYPPRCTAKCGSCNPCKPVHVPVPPGRLVTTMEYYPEAWRCKCGNVLFMP